MTIRLAGVAVTATVLFATGLSTGGRLYYLLFFTIVILTLLSLASVLWVLYSVQIEMKGVRPRVERGAALMTIYRSAYVLSAGFVDSHSTQCAIGIFYPAGDQRFDAAL